MRLKLIHQDSQSHNQSIKESEIVVTLGVAKVSKNFLRIEFDPAVGNGKESRLEVNLIYDCYLASEEGMLDPKEIIEEYIEEITNHTVPIISTIDKSMEDVNMDLSYSKGQEYDESHGYYS